MLHLITLTLAVGIVQDGEAHKVVTLGPLSVADILRMEDKEKGVEAGTVSGPDYLCTAMAARVVEWPGIPRERITATFLKEHLAWPDLMHLREAAVTLDARLERFRREQLGAPVADDGARDGARDADGGAGDPAAPTA